MLAKTTAERPLARPFRKTRGADLYKLVASWIDEAKLGKLRPHESRDEVSDAMLAIAGSAFGTQNQGLLSTTGTFARGSGLADGERGDGSLEFMSEQSTRAHLMGEGLKPKIAAFRGMTQMATMLGELESHRWDIDKTDDTMQLVLSSARLRGTGACIIYRNPHTKLATVEHVPTPQLHLDETCDGDLKKTKWRAINRRIHRYELRETIRKAHLKELDFEGAYMPSATHQSSLHPAKSMELSQLDQDIIDVIDFYYDDGNGYRRRILFSPTYKDDVLLDLDRWPYDLPYGEWPIKVFAWNPQSNSPWGHSDFFMTYTWHHFLSWASRFILVAAAQAAKVVPVVEQSLGTDEIAKLLGNLKEPFAAVQLDLLDHITSNIKLEDLINFLDVPSNLNDLYQAEELSRQYVGQVTGLTEMQEVDADPLKRPARLTQRKHLWKSFNEDVLRTCSIIDVLTKPQKACIEIRRPADQIPEEKRANYKPIKAYVEWKDALILRNNRVPDFAMRGMTAEQFGPMEKQEMSARRSLADNHTLKDAPVTLEDTDIISIIDPGIANYISRSELVPYWWSDRMNASQICREFTFAIVIQDAGLQSEQYLQKIVGVMEALKNLYAEWGLTESAIAWSQDATNQPVPQMLLNLVEMHDELLRASSLPNYESLSISPYDIAQSMAAGAQAAAALGAAEQGGQGGGGAGGPAPEELAMKQQELEIKRMVAEAKVTAEMLKQENERLRQTFDIAREQRLSALDQAKFAQEMEKLPYLTEQQRARSEASQARTTQQQLAIVSEQLEALKKAVEIEKKAGMR